MTANQQLPSVTLILDQQNPNTPWQIVDENQRILQTFKIQGDAVSWLLGNGYKWITASQPQQWIKP
jgi:hypothetical protein